MTPERTRDAAVAIVGVALVAAAWLLWPALFPHAWLAAVFTLLAWPLGSMALLLVHALTGGRWGDAIRFPLLLGVASLPLIVLAAVPIALVLPALYPWVHQDVARDLANTFYLNLPFFAGRAALYAVVWLGIAVATFLGARGHGPALQSIAPPCLILLAITTTFAAIDLTASLDPKFNSSVYGMLTGTGMVLFALSLASLIALPTAHGRGRDDLGKLLLALCVLWAYLDFVQYLVVWSSNLSHDAPWYQRRVAGFWGWAMGAMALLHGLVPLFLLAIPRFRRMDGLVMALAAALVASGVLRSWWLVLPEAGRVPSLVDVACMLGLGAAAFGLLRLARSLPALSQMRAHG